MAKILILTNTIEGLYNFRYELLERLINEEFEIYFSIPESKNDTKVKKLIELGCNYIETNLDRRSINPFKDLNLVKQYEKIVKKIRPNIITSYTIKPNIYGSYVAKKYKIPIIINVTGLGSGFNNNNTKWLVERMYKYACKNAYTIFFQNESNYNYFIENKITKKDKSKIIPGSGVNLEKFKPMEKTKEDGIVRFLFMGRIMKEKGIEEYLKAAEYIADKYSNVEFQILGRFEEEKYKEIILNNNNSKIKYLGVSYDVRNEIKEIDCIINPTYHEGMSNVLLEGAAMAKPLLSSNIPGCREIVDNGVNGYLFEPKMETSLIKTIEKFLSQNESDRIKMGIASRQKVERSFDRNLVIDIYLEEIAKILKSKKERIFPNV
ncbi:glycosyltransferase family 4 protein [Petrotoga sp. 9PW.55.5.1]|uniref:glycosyltransferase family 4 protein n=1 Tax=Petrotoga sp. 9PW.55.5.1 TaxID=1308979 RepID=UPI000DDBD560|nr:glycosyltransferase family 4 protein [Petrotoga sp. 9PW.55.5.1]